MAILFILCCGISATGVLMALGSPEHHAPYDPVDVKVLGVLTVVFGLLTWATWP